MKALFAGIAVVVCGSVNSVAVAAERHGPGHDHHDFPAAVAEFHNVMAPLWHAPQGSARVAATCAETKTLDDRARAIGESGAPQGVAPSQWAAAAKALLESVAAMAQACGAAAGQEAESGLALVHERFHDVARLVGHRH